MTTALAPVASGANFMDPAWLLQQYGGWFFALALVIVFVECGLFFPFLPGDSLLFAIGIFSMSSADGFDVPLYVSVPALMVAAFLGNVVGYEIGRAVGQPLYRRDGRIIKRKYFDRTNAFFDEHGNKAIVIGRFVPVVRTFVTVVAGVGRMDRRRFFTWSGFGAVLWVGLIVAAGCVLGNVPWIRDNLEIAVLTIVALSVVPMAVEYVLHKRRSSIALEAAEFIDEKFGDDTH